MDSYVNGIVIYYKIIYKSWQKNTANFIVLTEMILYYQEKSEYLGITTCERNGF